jgi:thymidylate kinase
VTKPGSVIVVVGPDGTGKSTLCAMLIDRLFTETPVMRVHHRFGVLRQRNASPTTEPHADPPYGRLLCEMKAVYLFVDYLLGWSLRALPFLRRGGWVVLERGWWDLAVDPARYRLRRETTLVRVLGRLLPAPDLLILLDCPPEILLARKAELPVAEVVRQSEAWRQFVAGNARAVRVDASLPPAAVLGRVVTEVGKALTEHAA